ncbi:MAG: tetratricopeptide repeat protein [Chloroflexi bacterium]|nr:tetratricopeptide repeat protein [Chloroflexota bacterium]
MALPEEGARFKRQRAELAVSLAMQSRWEEAVAANQSIVAIFPTDVDALNRLGKAYMELGRYTESSDAYGRALQIEPSNTIAKKNLARLSELRGSTPAVEVAQTSVNPRLFIEETGKTTVVMLQQPGAKEVIARVTAGERVLLKQEGRLLQVTTVTGEYLGLLEPRIGIRLVNLMQGGNKYEAAVTSVSDQHVRIIIRETHQAPEMAGRLSFPSRGDTGFRPYIKESILRYGWEEEEEEHAEEEESGEWDESTAEEGGIVAETLPLEQEDDDDDREEEY